MAAQLLSFRPGHASLCVRRHNIRGFVGGSVYAHACRAVVKEPRSGNVGGLDSGSMHTADEQTSLLQRYILTTLATTIT